MFFDFNIPIQNVTKEQLRLIVGQLKELGYHGVAYNAEISGKLQASNICSIEKLEDIENNVNNNNNNNDNNNNNNTETLISLSPKTFKQFTRITYNLEHQNQVHALSSSNNQIMRSYDIIAVRPFDEKLFATCCNELEIDIIVLEGINKQSFALRVPAIKQAIERGIHFEINYSHLLNDDHNSLRTMISNAINLIRITKGRNILITSAANNSSKLRSPYDVSAIGSLFGMQLSESQNALSTNCLDVIKHAETRKTLRATISTENVCNLSTHEMWKIAEDERNLVELAKKEKQTGSKRKRSNSSNNNSLNNNNPSKSKVMNRS